MKKFGVTGERKNLHELISNSNKNTIIDSAIYQIKKQIAMYNSGKCDSPTNTVVATEMHNHQSTCLLALM